MDSNFQVKVTADLSEFYKSIKLAADALTKLDGVVRDVGKASDYASTAIAFKLGGGVEEVGKKAKKTTEQVADAGSAIQKTSIDMNRLRLASFALGQVIRDSGFFAQNFGLGILAISNNIPILIDQLVMLAGVSEGVGAALSLVGSIITAGLTIWAYSAMAVDRNKQSIDEYVKSLDDVREARLKGTSDADAEIRTLELLRRAAQDETFSKKERLKAVKEIQDKFPDYYNGLSAEAIMAGKDAIAHDKLASAIRAVADARAREELIRENRKVELADNQKLIDLQAEKIKLEKDLKALNDRPKNYNSKTGRDESFEGLRLGLLDKIKEKEDQIFDVAKERNKAKQVQKNLEQGILDSLENQKSVAVITGDFGQKSNQQYGQLGKEVDVVDKRMKSIVESINIYRDRLSDIEKTPGISSFDVKKQSLEALGDLIVKLEQIEGTQDTVSKLKDKFNDLNVALGNMQFGIPLFKIIPEAIKNFKDEQLKNLQELTTILNNGIADAIPNIAGAIGQALGDGSNVAKAAGSALLSSLGDILVNLGKMALKIGLGLEAIKKSLESLNPGLAIAAGIGLIALGSFFKGQASKIAGNIGGNNNSDSQSSPSSSYGGFGRPFASGGIVSGPTQALVGEYPGARSNPEVIAPLDKLKSIIGGTGNIGYGAVIAETRVSGNDLSIILKRADKNRNGYF